MDRELADKNILLNVALETNRLATVVQMVATDLGVVRYHLFIQNKCKP